MRLCLAAFVALFAFAAPAQAEVLNFRAALNGHQAPTETGSSATGSGGITVDTEDQSIDVFLRVDGISLDGLWDHVIHSGMGPVHLHLYAANGDISLLVPFVYGPAYIEEGEQRFTLMLADYSYAEGAAVLGSTMTFEEFVAALGSDFVYFNVHTDAFQDGEISGRLFPAPVPQ